jgi:hypothetical protein
MTRKNGGLLKNNMSFYSHLRKMKRNNTGNLNEPSIVNGIDSDTANQDLDCVYNMKPEHPKKISEKSFSKLKKTSERSLNNR